MAQFTATNFNSICLNFVSTGGNTPTQSMYRINMASRARVKQTVLWAGAPPVRTCPSQKSRMSRRWHGRDG